MGLFETLVRLTARTGIVAKSVTLQSVYRNNPVILSTAKLHKNILLPLLRETHELLQ